MNRPILHAVVVLTWLTALPSVGMAQVYSWSGVGSDGNWTTNANWVGGNSPYSSASLPIIVLQRLSNRNTTLDQSLSIEVLIINTDGYTVANANAAVLSIGIPTSSNTRISLGSNVRTTITAPVVLNGGAGTFDIIGVSTGGDLNLAGPVSTSGSQDLRIIGGGLLRLSGNNSGITAPITINFGTLQIGSTNALGSLSAGTTVEANGTLDLNGQIGVAEPLMLNGSGVGDGALINSSATAAVVTSTVLMDSNSSIGGTGTITLSGLLGDTATGHDLTKVGPGSLVLNNPTGSKYRGSTTISEGTLIVNNVGGSGTGTGTGAAATVSINHGGRLAGTGIISQPVTVNSGGTIRGGDPLDPISATNRRLTLNGGATLLGGSTVQIAFVSPGGGVGNPTQIQFESGLNLGTASSPLTTTNKLLINLTMESGANLTAFQPCKITFASGTGGITLNGVAAPATIDPSLYNVAFGFDVQADNVSLTTIGSNLVLSFTPVPEPTTILAVVAAGLGVRRWYQKRLSQSGPAL